jgi:hypothetical protein
MLLKEEIGERDHKHKKVEFVHISVIIQLTIVYGQE